MPPPPMKPPAIVKPPSGATAKPPARPAKTFKIASWSDADEGEKIVVYGKSGMGKTTLASMAPGAVFLGVDDGGRKISNGLTGEPVNAIAGIEGFQDVRDALHQSNLFAPDATIVIDTVTKLEALTEPYIFENYKQNGKTVTAMRQYGWDGPAHLLDCMRLLLSDLDAHIRVGRNVILLAQVAQITVANAEGIDYLEDGPKLQHNKQYSVRTEVCEWADHVCRIGYQEFNVARTNDKDKAGKVVSTDGKRAVYTGGAQHFMAKSRPVNGNPVPPVVTFDAPNDNSLWQFIFEGATVSQETA